MLSYVDPQFASPYAMPVFVALHEKRLPFALQTLDLAAGAHHQPAYARTSITQRVPTLVDGDFALSESSAITGYLDEIYRGPALYPSATRAHARARQVQAWLRSDLPAIRQERSTEVVFYGPTSRPLSVDGVRAAAKLFAGAADPLAHGGDNLCGDQWCIADVDLVL